MKYLELLNKVEQWAKDRGLDTVEARTQYSKLIEEQGELGLAMLEDNINGDSGVKDSLGDYQVTLIIYCLIRGIDFKKQVEEEGSFWTEYDDLAQKHKEEGSFDVNKVFNYLVFSSSRIISAYNRNRPIQLEHLSVERVMECLHDIAKEYGTSLEETLEMAYNEIKDRKGKMIDGVFVKEEDLKD
ncbi:MazG-like family protein [Ligilactobacillus salivarius]|uniref:MazG-like family protein n=1 Tax=Ligilactobacillus salivarius TaxID=1624 RepID=UPI000BAF9B43|nr:MazG-like family protein [Ligilactobacillus salivarius]PAY51895.1 hypothetical protein A8C37_00725 [Ligilactobacillus salivarius]